MTHLSWVALHGMAYSSIELCKPLLHDKAMIHEGGYNLYTQFNLSEKYIFRFEIILLLLTRCLNCHSIIIINI